MSFIPRDYNPSAGPFGGPPFATGYLSGGLSDALLHGGVSANVPKPSAMMQAWMREEMSKAVDSRDLKRAEDLIKQGYDLETNNSLGQTVLHEAVLRGQAEFVLFFVVMGARTSAINPEGKTAWNVAAELKEPHCLKALELGLYFYQQKFTRRETAVLTAALKDEKAEKPPEEKPAKIFLTEADHAEARRAAMIAALPKRTVKLKK
jgi:hypothetical protein